MNQPGHKLTDDQRDFLASAVTKISEAFAELQDGLVELGWGDGDSSCMRCDCEFFVPPDSPPHIRCARPTCAHGFISHNVF